jgi:hypothetical protein
MKKAMFAIVSAATLYACGCGCMPPIPKLSCCWVSALADLIGVLGGLAVPA